MSTLEIVAASLRGAHVAALMSLFGTLVLLTLVVASAMAEATVDAPRLRQRLLRVARFSTIGALITGVAWLMVETMAIAGTDSVASTLHALPVIALRTQFGRWLLLRCSVLLVVAPLLGSWRKGIPLAVVMAAIALAVQPMLGHVGAVGGGVGTTLILSEVMHLLAAGMWLGGLLPLFITIGTLPHEAAATACRSFTPIGLSAVLVLGGTAAVQVAQFMGGLPGLFGTGYGHVALVKLGLFVVLLVLAALNRLALTDRLGGTAAASVRRHMRISIATEAALGALVVVTAGFLASHMPGAHEQPVWPFAWRPSLSVLDEPDLRVEVIMALLALSTAVIFAIAGVVRHRVRRSALVVALIIVALSAPHLDLLFVAAYPTSFFTSPTEFATTAIVHGGKLYAANCAACHGSEGHGNGAAAKSLPIAAADLTAEHFWQHSDGELFWYIAHGFEAPGGGVAMPGFSDRLSSEARWDLIDYLRARNVGESMRTIGKWSHPVPVPQFDATCADGRTVDLDDLRGRVLRIVAVSDDDAATVPVPPAGTDVATIILTGKPTTRSNSTACVAREPETWPAFAILLGVPSEGLAGKQVLVDQNGWLRAQWQPGNSGDWTNPEALAAAVRDIMAQPIAADAVGGHAHHH